MSAHGSSSGSKHGLEMFSPTVREDGVSLTQAEKEEFYDNYGSKSNLVQRTTVVLVAFIIAMLFVLIALTSTIEHKVSHPTTVSSYTVAYPSLGLPKYEQLSWNDVTDKVYGTTVNFWMWNGSTVINEWVDNWLAKEVYDRYGITLVRPNPKTAGAATAIAQIQKERTVGNNDQGAVDLVWINGENFYNGMKNNDLYGPWATKVPSAVNFDFNADNIGVDFGTKTNGFEMPYNAAQVVFIYNSKYISSAQLPKTMKKLVEWTVNNPGKFTYAKPYGTDNKYDFTGSVFTRHFFYEYSGPYSDFYGEFNSDLYNSRAKITFDALKSMETNLYKKAGVPYYAQTHDEVETLFGQEEIWITLSYDPSHASNKVADGTWPNTTNTWLPSSGTISNTNFLAIGYNAKNILGGVVVANTAAEIASQFVRKQPEGWGALQCYNPSAPALTTGGWQTAFDYLKLGPQTPLGADLRKAAMPELSAKYILQLQNDWRKCVLLGQSVAPCV